MIAVASPDAELAEIACFKHVGAHGLVGAVAGLGALIPHHQAIATAWRSARLAECGGYHDIAWCRVDRRTNRDELCRLERLKAVRAIGPCGQGWIVEPTRSQS